MSKTNTFVDLCKAASEGTTNRVRLKEDRFLNTEIPLPPLAEQRRLVERIDALAAKIEEAKGQRAEADESVKRLVICMAHRGDPSWLWPLARFPFASWRLPELDEGRADPGYFSHAHGPSTELWVAQ